MERSDILKEIAHYCRQAGMAESTFGRKAVNDGKLVSRIRDGGRISVETWGRIRSYMRDNPPEVYMEKGILRPAAGTGAGASRGGGSATKAAGKAPDGEQDFRFFDNRQKYLMFVNTCSEKWVVADRVSLELGNIHPRPPAVRVFDAGIGDGTVLARVMRAMHNRYPTMPFYIVGKEISLEDIRLSLDKMPDRFFEHPSTVLVLTNLYYSEAPWLMTKSTTAASSFVWKECALQGNSSHEFEQQIAGLQGFLSDNWQARIGKNGNPIYDRPVVLVLYREDHKFLLDQVIPQRGTTRADYDLIVASQPYRARASAEFKATKVVGPLARALGPGGRLIGIHSHGDDPGLEIIQKVWPGENPFVTDRHQILKAVKAELGSEGRDLNFNAYSDKRSIFRYDMHTLPNEVSSSIGTSTAFAAWNAAVYVAQVEDERLEEVTTDGRYLDVTRDVLQEHGGLWFNDESYVISRRRD
ncbi:MAG: hypothetical protein RLT05_28890 [Bauldia litoralis]